jgi:hypothetical protein
VGGGPRGYRIFFGLCCNLNDWWRGTTDTFNFGFKRCRGAQGDDPNVYFIDTLFRSDTPSRDRTDAQLSAETKLIFANALRQGNLSEADRTYLAKLVAAKTGVDQTAAEQRVSEVFTEIQRAAETARKAAAHLSLWIFVALLIGAFCASYAATIGGRERDHVKLI